MNSHHLQLHKPLLLIALFLCSTVTTSVVFMTNLKPFTAVNWIDVIGEGGIALITLCWLVVTVISRPKGRVTYFLFFGILMVHISMLLDLLDEFMRYKADFEWFSKLEAIPAVAGLVLLSITLYHWQKEQVMLNNRLVKSERFYREHSFYDFVTGLYSANYMKKQICSELHHFKGQGTPFCLCLFDIKAFSDFTRLHGFEKANTLLHDIASLIQINIRENDLACRYAADRFIVLCPNTELKQCQQIGRQIQNMASQLVNYNNTIPSKTSLYVSTIEVSQADNLESLLLRLNNTLDSNKRAA